MKFTISTLCAAALCVLLQGHASAADSAQPWMDSSKTPQERAQLLVAALSTTQKMQQLTGANPEVIAELPQCFGARHVSGIAALHIPTFRITNGPVGLGQNDCVDAALADDPAAKARYAVYIDASSAKATALPSAMAAAASFDPNVAASYGKLIGTEMHNLALHEFEAPGMNMARLPILGRNFEYFGEDPFLTGTMAIAEIKSIQSMGIIGMAKHFIGNEQETNRMTIRETIDPQTLREIYLIPFEMAVKDAKVASVMCAYNYVNGSSSCENGETLTKILRNDWGFTGYVQSDFFAAKTTDATLANGMDFMMPMALQWAPDKLKAALAEGKITTAQIDQALLRRYTEMFRYGIFDRPLKQTPIDYAAGGVAARAIGVESAVLLQNDNKVLPFAASGLHSIALVGKASQIYAQTAVVGGQMLGQKPGAGGGSSDVVPTYVVTPLEGLHNALKAAGNTAATVQLILVSDDNSSATVDGVRVPIAQALRSAADADAVVMMAGTIAEEGADRASFANASGSALAEGANAATGNTLDWYVTCPNSIGAVDGSKTCAIPAGTKNIPANSHTVEMIKLFMAAKSGTGKSMAQKTALVLKDNAGVAMDPALLGATGPAMLETWFPGQEDGNIVADLLFGAKNPAGKLPVTFPVAGKGFLDNVSAAQFPGLLGADGKTMSVNYAEKLAIGYRWYDANLSGQCQTTAAQNNPCVAFPFGHGLSYTSFSSSAPTVREQGGVYEVTTTVTNTGQRAGAQVVQVYMALPQAASAQGAAQPPKRLVGFQKVELAPGQVREVRITIDPAASNHPLSLWSTAANKWVTVKGAYTVLVGDSSSPKDLRSVTLTR